MNLFSAPKAPRTPPTPSRTELQVDKMKRDTSLNFAIRDQILERRTLQALRGRTSMVNPGLGIPE